MDKSFFHSTRTINCSLSHMELYDFFLIYFMMNVGNPIQRPQNENGNSKAETIGRPVGGVGGGGGGEGESSYLKWGLIFERMLRL